MKRTYLSLVLALAISTLTAQDTFTKTTDGGSLPAAKRIAEKAQVRTRLHPRLLHSQSEQDADATVSVVIVYKSQPHSGIVERVESRVSPQKNLAKAELGRVTGNPSESAVREKLDRLTIETRQMAKSEIEASVSGFQSAKTARLEGMGATNVRRFWSQNMLTAKVPVASLAWLAEDEDVAEILPMPVMHISATTVTNEGMDVNVGVLGLASWWNAGFTGKGQDVVVMDTGINATHPIFNGKQVIARAFLESIRKDRCFADEADSARDNVGHGSHVAGIVAGAGDSLLPVFQGTSPGVGRIFALKIGARLSGRNGCGDNAMFFDDIIDGLQFAIENTPATIINMSFGGETNADDAILARVIDSVADTFGLTIVVAAGNSGTGGVGDTGLTFNGITVANMDTRGTFTKQDDRVAASSSRGPTAGGRFKPDVSAPGTQILSASNVGSSLVRLTGTSMAAPKVAGVAAVLHQAGIDSPAAVKAMLINTTDQVGWKADRGWGFVNMENARAANSLANTEVTPNGFVLFRGRNTGNFYATLAWNRHIVDGAPVFHDLDLSVFDASGTQLAVSESSEQNVEQVSTTTDGDVIVKVKAFDQSFEGGLTREPFALAMSQKDFVAATGPVLDIRCSPSSTTVARGASFNMACTVANRGDLTGNDTQFELKVDGVSGSSSVNLNAMRAGDAVSGSFPVTAPGQAGTMTFNFLATTSAAGETMSSSASVQVTVR